MITPSQDMSRAAKLGLGWCPACRIFGRARILETGRSAASGRGAYIARSCSRRRGGVEIEVYGAITFNRARARQSATTTHDAGAGVRSIKEFS